MASLCNTVSEFSRAHDEGPFRPSRMPHACRCGEGRYLPQSRGTRFEELLLRAKQFLERLLVLSAAPDPPNVARSCSSPARVEGNSWKSNCGQTLWNFTEARGSENSHHHQKVRISATLALAYSRLWLCVSRGQKRSRSGGPPDLARQPDRRNLSTVGPYTGLAISAHSLVSRRWKARPACSRNLPYGVASSYGGLASIDTAQGERP